MNCNCRSQPNWRTLSWFVLLCIACAPLWAQRPPLHDGIRDTTEIRKVLDNLQTDDDFSEYRKVQHHRFKPLGTGNVTHVAGGRQVAEFLRYMLWSIALLLVAAITWQNLRTRLAHAKEAAGKPQKRPTELFGLSIDKNTLPENIPADAQRLWQDNQYRAALSLLYRGALSVLNHRYRVTLPDGATENDCVLASGAVLDPQQLQYIKDLTCAWQRLAYAHQALDIEQFRALCESYRQQAW